MNPVQPASPDLAAVVRDRSWAWLFQLATRFHVAVHIVDLRAVAVLSDVERADALRAPEFVAAVGRAQRAETTETIAIGSSLVACAVLRLGTVDLGVLTVVSAMQGEHPTPIEERRLDQIASWLRSAVEAHLASDANRSTDEAARLTALRRVLAESRVASELERVRVFGEAVSVWEDLEVRAYDLAAGEEFVLKWSPPGTVESGIPDRLTVPAMLQTRELTRLSVQSLHQLSIGANGDVVLARLAPNGSRWLLVVSGEIDPACLGRLSLYIDVLEQSLKYHAVSTSRDVSRRISRHLLARGDDPAPAAHAALTEIRRAAAADLAALVITGYSNARLVSVGDVDDFGDLHAPTDGRRLTFTRTLAGGATLVVALGRHEARDPFSTRERDLVDETSELFEPWAAALLERLSPPAERRASPRPFQELAEELAEHTVRRGGNVSVLVIRMPADAFRRGTTSRLAAQLRSHLRAAEPAGALTDREIAAVLVDTNPDQARAVIARLRRLAAHLDEGAALASAAMGVAHREGGSPYDSPLVIAARQDALRRQGATSFDSSSSGTSVQ